MKKIITTLPCPWCNKPVKVCDHSTSTTIHLSWEAIIIIILLGIIMALLLLLNK